MADTTQSTDEVMGGMNDGDPVIIPDEKRRKPPPWAGAFDVSGPHGELIPLRQFSSKEFELGEVKIRYQGKTGLERFQDREGSGITREKIEQIRYLDQNILAETDLASVPGPMRWFTNTYGPHTPAALIHDWLIPGKNEEPVIPEHHADRYFRYMLGSVGVRPFKRGIMLTAVALRTRFMSQHWWKPLLMVVWLIVATLGVTAFFWSFVNLLRDQSDTWGIDTGLLMFLSLLAPLVSMALWGKQAMAALVAAIGAPLLLPAAILASVGYGGYLIVERAVFDRVDQYFPSTPDPN